MGLQFGDSGVREEHEGRDFAVVEGNGQRAAHLAVVDLIVAIEPGAVGQDRGRAPEVRFNPNPVGSHFDVRAGLADGNFALAGQSAGDARGQVGGLNRGSNGGEGREQEESAEGGDDFHDIEGGFEIRIDGYGRENEGSRAILTKIVAYFPRDVLLGGTSLPGMPDGEIRDDLATRVTLLGARQDHELSGRR